MNWSIVGVVTVGLSAITFGGLKYRTKVIEQQKRALFNRRAIEFDQGTLPLIPGPYLEKGNVVDLKFKVIELPSMTVKRISEAGDLLMSSGPDSGVGEYKDWAVFTRDLKVKKIPNISKAFMDPSGGVYAIRYDEKTYSIGTIAKPDGTSVRSENAYRLATFGGFSSRASSKGVLEIGSATNNLFGYYDFTGTYQKVPFRESGSFFVYDSSSAVGDVGVQYPPEGGNSSGLGIFRNKRIEFEDIPIPHEFFHIHTSKNLVAVTAGETFYQRAPYLRTGKESYRRIGVPKGADQTEIMAMNSHDEYLVDVCYPDPTVLRKGFKERFDQGLISGNRYYRLKDIEKKYFAGKMGTTCGITSSLFDERGDLVASYAGRSYLLLRQ